MTVKLEKKDEIWMKVETEDVKILKLIYYSFSFFAPNYIFSKEYIEKTWDGKIYLFDANNKQLHIGLLEKLEELFKLKGIDYTISEKLKFSKLNIKLDEIQKWIKSLNLKTIPHDFQEYGIYLPIVYQKAIIISATGSGKSYLIYLYLKYLRLFILKPDDKILIVVPKLGLIRQTYNNFIEYEQDTNDKTISQNVHMIYSGKEKDSDKTIYLSTWQSIYNLHHSYFKKFKVLIIDEVHHAKAKSLTKITEHSSNAVFRLGTTGTLDDIKVHHSILKGLFWKIIQVSKAHELIERKILAPLKIYNIVLKYPNEDRLMVHACKLNYNDELKFVLSSTKRNNFIADFICKLSKNVLFVFNRIEYGEGLYNKVSKAMEGKKKVLYLDGKMKADDREWVRNEMERDNYHILFASSQCFSTGIDIHRIHNIIMPFGGKSKIQVLQTIGRGLRLHESKEELKVIDFVDDLTYQRKKNILLNQHDQRLNYYIREKYPHVEKIFTLGGKQ